MSATATAREWVYDQPYLGPKTLRMYSGEQVWEDRSFDFGYLVAESDLIFIGTFRDAKAVKLEPGDGQTEYTADVRIGDVYHGMPRGESLPLQWKMWTTGVADGARMLFFVKQEFDPRRPPRYHVLHAAFMHKDEVNVILLYSLAHTMRTDFVLKTLRVAIDGKATDDYRAELVKQIRGNPAYTPLLSALPMDLARPAWWAALESGVSDHTGLARFAALARDIVARGEDEDIAALLEFTLTGYGGDGVLEIPFKPGQFTWYRFAEFIVYDLLRHRGGERMTKLLIAHTDRHPQAAVSSGFALAAIGGEVARAAIARWRDDPKIANRAVEIMEEFGFAGTARPYKEMLELALEREME